MAAIGDGHRTPPAVIHKRILDVAGERPEASMAEIAETIGGASTDLVERVLAEYGDPAGGAADGASSPPGATDPTEEETPMSTDSPAEGNGAETATKSEPDGTDDTGELSEKQRAVLRAIHEHPDATQRELGERLGVSASTVSNRLSGIEGFSWADRWQFVRERFGGATDGGETVAVAHDLGDRLDALEARVAALEEGAVSPEARPPLPPELAHKVVHACIESDRLDEDEELAVLRALMAGTASDQ